MSLWFTSVAAAALIAGAPASSSPPQAYEAPCPSGVSGGLPADYERSSLLAGPLALYPVRGDYARYPARYPRGGLHGDHAIVVWNERGRGHLVSLHFHDELDPGRYDRDDRIAAALAVAAS